MRRDTAVLSLTVALALSTLLLLAGCGAKGPQWVDADASYTGQSVSSVYATADISLQSGVSAADTTKQRHDALLALRKRGGAASDAADLITKTMPTDTRGVPVYVERAKFNGEPSLVIVEAIGPASGKLTTKRLWVLSTHGAVLFVGTH